MAMMKIRKATDDFIRSNAESGRLYVAFVERKRKRGKIVETERLFKMKPRTECECKKDCVFYFGCRCSTIENARTLIDEGKVYFNPAE